MFLWNGEFSFSQQFSPFKMLDTRFSIMMRFIFLFNLKISFHFRLFAASSIIFFDRFTSFVFVWPWAHRPRHMYAFCPHSNAYFRLCKFKQWHKRWIALHTPWLTIIEGTIRPTSHPISNFYFVFHACACVFVLAHQFHSHSLHMRFAVDQGNLSSNGITYMHWVFKCRESGSR